MKRLHRLRSSPDIERTLRSGRRSDGIFFRLIVLPNHRGYFRLALVVPRFVNKRASVRNRLRRRAREWVRARPDILRIPADAALVFKKQSSSAPRKIFYEELARAFGISAP